MSGSCYESPGGRPQGPHSWFSEGNDGSARGDGMARRTSVGRTALFGTALAALAALTAGCTQSPAHKAPPPIRTPRPRPSPVAGPAHPVGEAARLGRADDELITLMGSTSLPEERPRPAQDAVVVIHRVRGDGGEVGWLSGDDFCLGYYRTAYTTVACGSYHTTAKAPVKVLGPLIAVDNFSAGSKDRDQPQISVAVVGDAGPYRVVGDRAHEVVLHQARAVLDPARPVTLLSWTSPAPVSSKGVRICDAAGAHCVDPDEGTALPPTAGT